MNRRSSLFTAVQTVATAIVTARQPVAICQLALVVRCRHKELWE